MPSLAEFIRLDVRYGPILLLVIVGIIISAPHARGQIVNGDFSSGGTGWTTVAPGAGDNVAFTGGTLVATSNNICFCTTGPNVQTFAQQIFTANDPGFLSYSLNSYTSPDIGDFDFPIARIDGVTFRIQAGTGNLIAGTPAINNSSTFTTPALNGVTTLAAGSHTIGFGAQSTDSGFGSGFATWDNIDFQEITISPSAQTTQENQPLTLAGANAPQTATNTSSTITVTLSVSNGILNLGSPGSVTITVGADGSNSITFAGTPTQINTAIDGLVYSPNTGFSGSDTLVFSASGGGVADTDNIAITVTPVNPSLSITKTASAPGFVTGSIQEAPVGTVITYTYVVTNDGDQPISNISLNDAHGGSGTLQGPGGETLTLDVGTAGDSSDGPSDGVWDFLAVGDAVTFTATYTVTQSDVDNLQ
ncbi:MAG: hypothetical protein AAF478_00445 [Pseudomonadota bacterium]